MKNWLLSFCFLGFVCISMAAPVQSLIPQEVSISKTSCEANSGAILLDFELPENRTIRLFDYKEELILAQSGFGSFEFTELPAGVYLIEVSSPSITGKYKTTLLVSNENFDDLQLRYGVTSPYCFRTPSGWEIDKGNVDLGFQDFDFSDFESLEVYFYDSFGELFQTEIIVDSSLVGMESVPLDSGSYLVMLRYNGCNFPVEFVFEVEGIEFKNFTVSPLFEIQCGENALVKPQSTLDFSYVLYEWNGDSLAFGKSFEIREPGDYYIVIENTGFCNVWKRFQVVTEQYSIPQLEIVGDPCSGEIQLRTTNDISEYEGAILEWLDADSGDVIGTGESLALESNKNVQLRVTNPDAPSCQVLSSLFEVKGILNPFEPELQVEKEEWCFDDPVNQIRLIDPPGNVDLSINWYKEESTRWELIKDAEDQLALEIVAAGIYQVSVQTGICPPIMQEITVKQVEVPVLNLDEIYDLCEYSDQNPLVVRLPNFQAVEWFKEGILVFSGEEFMPGDAGTYFVRVWVNATCFIEKEIEFKGGCEPLVRIPNALYLEDPDRCFKVFYNRFVHSLSVVIYNRQGELIYFIDKTGLSEAQESCVWDGRINGTNVLPGTYTVLVNYSSEDGREKTWNTPIFVID